MTFHNPTPALLRAQAQPDPTPALAARYEQVLAGLRLALKQGRSSGPMEREWPLAVDTETRR